MELAVVAVPDAAAANAAAAAAAEPLFLTGLLMGLLLMAAAVPGSKDCMGVELVEAGATVGLLAGGCCCCWWLCMTVCSSRMVCCPLLLPHTLPLTDMGEGEEAAEEEDDEEEEDEGDVEETLGLLLSPLELTFSLSLCFPFFLFWGGCWCSVSPGAPVPTFPLSPFFKPAVGSSEVPLVLGEEDCFLPHCCCCCFSCSCRCCSSNLVFSSSSFFAFSSACEKHGKQSFC